MKRYYLGVDWAEDCHQVYISDEEGKKDKRDEGPAEPQRGWLSSGAGLTRGSQGIELWAAIEKPHGRIVDFLLDHGWWFIRSIPRRWIGRGIGFA